MLLYVKKRTILNTKANVESNKTNETFRLMFESKLLKRFRLGGVSYTSIPKGLANIHSTMTPHSWQ